MSMPICSAATPFITSLFQKLIRSPAATPGPTSPTSRTMPPTLPPLPSFTHSSPPIAAKSVPFLHLVVFNLLRGLVEASWFVAMFVATLDIGCYSFTRLYPTVVRRVDSDVYKTVEWAEFIPHAGSWNGEVVCTGTRKRTLWNQQKARVPTQ
jgi:hypothetical protein